MPHFCPTVPSSVPFRATSCFQDLCIICFRLRKKIKPYSSSAKKAKKQKSLSSFDTLYGVPLRECFYCGEISPEHALIALDVCVFSRLLCCCFTQTIEVAQTVEVAWVECHATISAPWFSLDPSETTFLQLLYRTTCTFSSNSVDLKCNAAYLQYIRFAFSRATEHRI
jgi:hypothetical protein